MSDEEVGPVLPSDEAPALKKRKVIKNESLYLSQIPDTLMYEKSYMHRDNVSHISVTSTDFIVTASVDGFVKFWKKIEKGIEFVKTYRAHSVAINSLAVSSDGLLVATCAADKTVKVFDVINFDMINILKLDYFPENCCWAYQKGNSKALLAVSNSENGEIIILDAKSTESEALIVKIHKFPVKQILFNETNNSCISIDSTGIIEYWTVDSPFSLPNTLNFTLKSQTGLYELVKNKATSLSLCFTPDFTHFAVYGSDRVIRIFKYSTGKLVKSFDESTKVVSEMHQGGTLIVKLDDIEFGKRLAQEKEIEKTDAVNLVFDESGNFILYATLIGIKVVNWKTNKVSRIIGRNEDSTRFLRLALYQGTPKKKGIFTLEMASSENPAFKGIEYVDPTLFCTAYKKSRFYIFSKTEPADLNERDVLNEKPLKEDNANVYRGPKGTQATIHTDFGDIVVKLFPDAAPKAVENFITLAKRGYYNGNIFHRVIRGFMIQTGDPVGDGTGGSSMWNSEFQDEFSKDFKHDRPYTLSMANAGPNTNGSQFFITTVETPWLDNKHTVFGRSVSGFDVVHKIERVDTDNNDRPRIAIHILSIDIK